MVLKMANTLPNDPEPGLRTDMHVSQANRMFLTWLRQGSGHYQQLISRVIRWNKHVSNWELTVHEKRQLTCVCANSALEPTALTAEEHKDHVENKGEITTEYGMLFPTLLNKNPSSCVADKWVHFQNDAQRNLQDLASIPQAGARSSEDVAGAEPNVLQRLDRIAGCEFLVTPSCEITRY